mgnify:CR=1 FL=1
MSKLEHIKALVNNLKNDRLFNLISKLIKTGEIDKVVYTVIGALMVIEDSNKDRVTLVEIAELLK